ncbi:MAG: hypothetical protein E7435_06450 [Ruminococcaceae bacterium]|nr:hypothetical protein [Oscillospiraceae bacterium]
MNKKRLLSTALMMLLIVGFLFAFPTAANAASASGSPDVGGAISDFFGGILKALEMILQGLIDLVAIIVQFFVDLVMMIVGLFS